MVTRPEYAPAPIRTPDSTMGWRSHFLFPGASQRDFMQDGDVVADDGGFPYHKPGGIGPMDATPDDGGGVDVHGKYFAGKALNCRALIVRPCFPASGRKYGR